jgi:hypothetical protein
MSAMPHLSTVGIPEVSDDLSSFTVYQNFPNPMADRSEISMYIPHSGKVHVMITDLQGKLFSELTGSLMVVIILSGSILAVETFTSSQPIGME